MEKMVRKQLYIGARQDEELKRKAKDLGVSEAEIVRASLEDLFSRDPDSPAQAQIIDLLKAKGVTSPAPRGSSAGVLRDAPVGTYLAGGARIGGAEMTELIEYVKGRRGLGTSGERRSKSDVVAWEEELAFMKARSNLAATGGERGWTREELYEEREG